MIIFYSPAQELLDAKEKNMSEAEVSLDFGITKNKIKIYKDFFIFGKEKISEEQLKKPVKDNKSCFIIKDGSLIKMQFFSEDTNKFYKLVPTKGAPSLEISGIRMHATKGISPFEDAKLKISSISPIKGFVLDTCTGLGYTSILASKHADFVVTCEKDKNVLEIAKLNPCSKALFENKNINILNTDIFNEIRIFKNNMFEVIIHDPPRLSLAVELYSNEFYNQLYRVLRNNGKIYHYVGNPGSRNRNVNLIANVIKRMNSAGFRNIKKVHYGVSAEK